MVAGIISSMIGICPVLHADTLAWWRFEAGPDGSNVVHSAADGFNFSPDIPDSSGNGNALSAWSTGGATGYVHRSSVPATTLPRTGDTNSLSVKNTGGFPALFTDLGGALQSITPAAWTIEVAFKPEANGDFRTLVGRDSQGAHSGDPGRAALYFQITNDDRLAIKFCDVSGYWHEAVSDPSLIPGFDFPTDNDGLTGKWQAAAATCDGATLRLYYRNLTDGDPSFRLVAEADLTASGSPGTALTAGIGSGADWTAGTWTVGRGLYAGGHTNRAYGFIDEVRISDTALSPGAFLLQPDLVTHSGDAGAGSLRQAIADAESGDTITFDPSLSGDTITLGGSELIIDKPLSIDASSLPDGITVDGNGSSRLFTINTTSTADVVDLIGLTLRGGMVSGTASPNRGGAIHAINSGLHIKRCLLTDNQAAFGGGLFATTCEVVVENSTFYANRAAGVSYPNGGAIYSDNSTTRIEHCTVTGNKATNAGAGLAIVTGSVTLADSIVATNGPSSVGSDISGTLASHEGVNFIGTSSGASGLGTADTHYLTGSPLLAPLGDYGGSTRTLHPLPGSPVIDPTGGSVISPSATDQRGPGFPRVVGGIADIGAVESGSAISDFLVDTAIDENDGIATGGVSLRDAIAFLPSGSSIAFEPSLSGAAIILGGTALSITRDLVINASSLPEGITISGDHTSRVFGVHAPSHVRLTSLNIIHGQTVNGGGIYNEGTLTLNQSTLWENSAGNYGGGIYNEGTLTLNQSTLWENSAGIFGGGIYNKGTLSLNHSTLSGNSAGEGFADGTGGGIFNEGTLTLHQSTVFGNSADDLGGGIYSDGTLNLSLCTLSDNSASSYGGGIYNDGPLTLDQSTLSGNLAASGGGIYNAASGFTVTLTRSIVAGNDPTGGDISDPGGMVTGDGTNFISGNPLLAPLGDYGGPTWTMPPLPGSPLIDAAGATTSTTDQRGFPRPNGPLPDIGAAEAYPLAFFSLADTDSDGIPDLLEGPDGPYPHLTVGTDDSTVDSDGDGSTDAEEIANMTNLYDPNDLFRILSFTRAAGFDPVTNPVFDVTLKTFPGLDYSFEQVPGLGTPVPLGGSMPAEGPTLDVQVTLDPGSGFVRARRE